MGLSGTWSFPSLIEIFAPPSGTITFVYAIMFLLATNVARDYTLHT
jgi:hypothetical protein